MANIYLRLSSLICAFHRHRDRQHFMRPDEPYKFKDSSEHAFLLRTGLQKRVGQCGGKAIRCYSQKEWDNMLAGKPPQGGDTILVRDPGTWITYSEICTLEGRKITVRTESFDYLCIQMPTTITLNGKVLRTNGDFILNRENTDSLSNLLTQEFYRTLQEWESDNYAFCNTPDKDGNIIKRSFPNILERFLLSYDIPVSKNNLEKKSLMRQMTRLRGISNHVAFKNIDYDIQYEDDEDKKVKCNFTI